MADYASNLIAALRGAAPEASDNPGINYFTPPPPAAVVSNWRASTSRPSGGNAFDPRILALRADALPNTTTAAKDPFAALRSGGSAFTGSRSSGFQSEPSAWSQMSEADQAAWYRDNPTASNIASTGLNLFSYTLPGQVLGYFNPEGMYNAQAVARGFSPTEGWQNVNDFSQTISGPSGSGSFGSYTPSESSAPSYYSSSADTSSDGGGSGWGSGYSSFSPYSSFSYSSW